MPRLLSACRLQRSHLSIPVAGGQDGAGDRQGGEQHGDGAALPLTPLPLYSYANQNYSQNQNPNPNVNQVQRLEKLGAGSSLGLPKGWALPGN